MPNPDLTLSPGMYGEGEIQLEQRNNVFTVPTQAIVQGSGQPYVLVADDHNHVQRRDVILGIQDQDRPEIASGLSDGEQVIIAGQSNLQTGELLRPMLTSTSYSDKEGQK